MTVISGTLFLTRLRKRCQKVHREGGLELDMSDSAWYVETILKTRYEIRSNILTHTNTDFGCVEDADLENNDYNNLLLVEKTLHKLVQNKQLSCKEIIILNNVLQYKSFSQIERETGMSRLTIVKFFENICDRVAFILGDSFTDEGYLDSLVEKYNLTEPEVEKARKYMNSNKQYYVLRKRKIKIRENTIDE